jgi:hypothetical protein
MVVAGTRNRKTQGAIINKVSIVEYPESRILNSPGLIHINHPVSARNTTITMYPVRDEKKDTISFL